MPPAYTLALHGMPRGSKTKSNNALSAGVSHRGWFQLNQNNQGSHRLNSDLDSSPSAGPDSDAGYAEHLRVMMRTRVAVRDKTPHRFQIVPLREVSSLGLDQTQLSNRLNVPTTPTKKLRHSPSGKLGPYSQTRTLQPASPTRSLSQIGDEGGEVRNLVARGDDHSQEAFTSTTSRSSGYPLSRRVLVELDLNRDSQVSMATTNFISKSISSKSVTMRSLPSRDLLPSFSHTETSITQNTPHKQHPTAHISQISQLFSSESVATLRSANRNRSMTVSSIRSDASVGMSDASQETETRLKRRHAIYRESSCMPYLDRSQDKNVVAGNYSSPVLGSPWDLAQSTNLDWDACSAETSCLQPPFEFRNLTPRPGPPHLSHSGLMPVRPLKLSKNKQVSRRMTANTGETVYPRIILDLFQDIDEAIAKWAEP